MLKLYKTLVCLIAVYMLTTLTYTLWPISSPNRIIGFLIFFNVLLIYCRSLTRKKALLLVASCGIVAISLFGSSDNFSYISDGIYLLIAILLLMELTEDYFGERIAKALDQSYPFVKIIVILCDLVLCVGFFDPRCYDSSQWDGVYYIGYTNASHTMAAGVCLLLIFSLYLIKGKKDVKLFIYFVPSIVAILRSGARIYLIPVIVVCLIFYKFHIRNYSAKIFLFPIVVVCAVYFFLNSSMVEKFTFSANNQYTDMNFLGRFSNGRTDFWIVDLLAFGSYSILQKLFGNGFGYVYAVNKQYFDLSIWAHNDFINCLLSVGLIGTFLYLYVFIRVCRKIVIRSKKNFLVKLLFLMYIVLPALLNGFYTYQHYFYSFLILFILYEKYYAKFMSK